MRVLTALEQNTDCEYKMGFQLSVLNDTGISVIVELANGSFCWHSEVVPPKTTTEIKTENWLYSVRVGPYCGFVEARGPHCRSSFLEITGKASSSVGAAFHGLGMATLAARLKSGGAVLCASAALGQRHQTGGGPWNRRYLQLNRCPNASSMTQ